MHSLDKSIYVKHTIFIQCNVFASRLIGDTAVRIEINRPNVWRTTNTHIGVNDVNHFCIFVRQMFTKAGTKAAIGWIQSRDSAQIKQKDEIQFTKS